MMGKYLLGLFLLILSLTFIQPAHASFCRQLEDHVVCLERIKRSAKNYWEYRVSLKVDGVVYPTAVYDCRDRLIIQKDGTVEDLKKKGVGALICQILD